MRIKHYMQVRDKFAETSQIWPRQWILWLTNKITQKVGWAAVESLEIQSISTIQSSGRQVLMLKCTNLLVGWIERLPNLIHIKYVKITQKDLNARTDFATELTEMDNRPSLKIAKVESILKGKLKPWETANMTSQTFLLITVVTTINWEKSMKKGATIWDQEVPAEAKSLILRHSRERTRRGLLSFKRKLPISATQVPSQWSMKRMF